MRFRKIFLICLVVLFSLIMINNIEKGECGYNVYYLESNKKQYNSDEVILLNSSWGLFFGPEDTGYVQIRIFNLYHEIVWNSSKYSQEGYSFYEEWNISLLSLDLVFEDRTSILEVKFYYYCVDFNGPTIFETYSNEFNITVFKRDVSCQFENIDSPVKYGENLMLEPIFYSRALDGAIFPLKYHQVTLQTILNKSILFSKNLTTNGTGNISFNLSTYIHLKIGNNTIKFLIESDEIIYAFVFKFSIIVEKAEIFREIIKFEKDDDYENIELEIFYYYLINNKKVPLKNQNITLAIYPEYEKPRKVTLLTNSTGYLKVSIKPNDINLTNTIKILNISLSFNGTIYLENNTFFKSFSYNYESKNQNLIDFNILIFFVIVLMIGSAIIISMLIMSKLKKKVKISDVTIRA